MDAQFSPSEFSPFYDPRGDAYQLSILAKVSIALSIGGSYILLQYLAIPDERVFFAQYCWVLGIIVSTSVMALYVATDVFRSSISAINKMQGTDRITRSIVDTWLSDKRFLIAGMLWATCNTAVAHLLGIPGELHATPFALGVMYLGYLLAGFTSGMGMLAIFAVIALYLRLAPELQHSLDPADPDGAGGLKQLSDSLWFFSFLIFAVGILVSLYMFAVDWQLMHLAYVRWVFLIWVSQPYVVAISIVLIPGLAVRRQVSDYKSHRTKQLRKQKTELHLGLKEFQDCDDDTIVKRQKEITDKLHKIDEELVRLRSMRTSQLDSAEDH